MVEALGALLRVTLSHKETISTIGSELEIVRNYMSIIQVRYDDRIEFRDEVPPALYEQALPQLTLQPLVENAINYALEEIPDTCTVQITGCLTPEETLLEITNNGSQFPEDLLGKLTRSEITPHGFGIGLLNIQSACNCSSAQTSALNLSTMSCAILPLYASICRQRRGNHVSNADR